MKFHFDGKLIIIFQAMSMLFQELRVQSARMIQEFDKKLQTLTHIFFALEIQDRDFLVFDRIQTSFQSF